MNLATLYTDQMIRALSRFDGIDDFVPAVPRGKLKQLFARMLARRGLEIVRRVKFNRALRLEGLDWPIHADTMIGVKRLENIRFCVKSVIEDNIDGDVIETGAWRGGGSIMLKACLAAYGDTMRKLWVADSFEGLPPPDLDRYPQDVGMTWHLAPELAVSLEQVKLNFQKYGLLDDRVIFLKGWFKDTLPNAPIEKLSILRFDGDLYASTMDVMNALYKKVTPGGFVIIDDYNIPEDVCRRAIDDFRKAHGISDPMVSIDKFSIYWRKS